MKFVFSVLVFLMLLTMEVNGQLTPCSLSSPPGNYETTKTFGSTVTLNWVYFNPLPTNFLYFRLRRSQAPAGEFAVWQRIYPDKCAPDPNNSSQSSCNFSFPADRTYWYFMTAVYQETVNGQTTLKETVGSNQVKIIVQ